MSWAIAVSSSAGVGWPCARCIAMGRGMRKRILTHGSIFSMGNVFFLDRLFWLLTFCFSSSSSICHTLRWYVLPLHADFSSSPRSCLNCAFVYGPAIHRPLLSARRRAQPVPSGGSAWHKLWRLAWRMQLGCQCGPNTSQALASFLDGLFAAQCHRGRWC
eukprot:scaffold270751_cov40-Tisochrysis_lutea.AAC.2